MNANVVQEGKNYLKTSNIQREAILSFEQAVCQINIWRVSRSNLLKGKGY